MVDLVTILALWLHSLATVILIGHFLLLALVYLPAIKDQPQAEIGNLLSKISKQSRTWTYASLVVFAITGTYLMLIDQNYLGFLNFGNLWGILMLGKHLLIAVMLAVGFWYNAILRVGPTLNSTTSGREALQRFQKYTNLMAILGILVLLMTAIAQLES